MFKVKLLLGIFLFAALLFSCAGETKKGLAKGTESKAIPDKIVLTDFEEDIGLNPYSGPQSKIEAVFTEEQAHSGKRSLKVTQKTKDWAGVAIILPKERADWTGLKTFRVWIYGGGSNLKFNIDIEDAKKEQFRYSFVDDFKGWKEFVIPISYFKSRTDWQASDARVDGKLDFPMMTVQVATANFGNFTLYFDDIVVEK